MDTDKRVYFFNDFSKQGRVYIMKYAIIIFLVAVNFGFADWQTPVNLGPPINTVLAEYYPMLVADGSYIIFTSWERPGGWGLGDLWRSRNVGGVWQNPENLGTNVNTSEDDSTPFLAEGDTKMYYTSKDLAGGYGSWDIYWCAITDGVPGTKTNVGPPINGADSDHTPVLTPDGNTMYFCSTRAAGGYGDEDIWVSEWTGSVWANPNNLGGVINTSSAERPHFITDDGTTLVFSSDRAGTYGGRDFWSSGNVGGVWQTPINLGPEVNSTSGEYGCTFYCNEGEVGGKMYFMSSREGGYGDADLWMSVDSGYVNISPASLGEIKATFR